MSPLVKIHDVLDDASSFVQAVFLAAAGLDKADVCAFQVLAVEIEAKLETVRGIIDEMPSPTIITADQILDAVKAEKARRAGMMGDQP
jgi:hypothetical protein